MDRILWKESLFWQIHDLQFDGAIFLNFDSGSEIVFDNSKLYKKDMLAF